MTSNERPTPETDLIEQGMFGSDPKLIADFARRLEREREEARDAAGKAKAFKRVMRDENAKLRRELDEARDDTRVLLKEIFNLTQIGDPHQVDLPMKALQAIAEMIDEQWKGQSK